jgi:hypothetical protein
MFLLFLLLSRVRKKPEKDNLDLARVDAPSSNFVCWKSTTREHSKDSFFFDVVVEFFSRSVIMMKTRYTWKQILPLWRHKISSKEKHFVKFIFGLFRKEPDFVDILFLLLYLLIF